MKKLLVLLLSVLVAGGAFAEGQGEMAAGEPLTITHMTEHCFNWPETTPPLLEEMNALLGVNWVHIPCPGGNGSYKPKIQVLLAAADLPDIFETYWIEELIQQGTSDLSVEEVSEYMPTFYGGLAAFFPSIGLDLQTSLGFFKRDGILKHYPMVWRDASNGHGYLWRKDYLDELGMDVPHTLEEWEAVFAAYKEAYPDRYAYGARCFDETLYRCFNAAANAFGLSLSRWVKRDGKLVLANAQPEMIPALEILARWYEQGYLDPEFVTVNGESEPFDAGVTIMKGWEHPNFPFDDERFHKGLKEHSPDAEFALTGPPQVEGYFPATYAWLPMHGNGHGIGRHNNDDRDRVHAIMEAVDSLNHRDNGFLVNYGIEGTHWSGVENNRPIWTEAFKESESRQGLGLGVNARNTPLSYWDIQAMKGFEEYIDPVKQAWLAEVRYSPDGTLGPNNVCMLTQSPVKPINDAGKDLWSVYQDRRVEGSALINQVIVGQKPVSAYQEWIDDYQAGWGPREGRSRNQAVCRRRRRVPLGPTPPLY